jgi:glucose-1-phosphate thymidylyltransferase
MKGIILAGGNGTRLYPVTNVVSKQLLPVYNKPMVYYPLSVLMLAGIKDILIITTPHDIENYKALLGDGKKIGINLQYKVQNEPDGLAQAFILGEEFIDNESVCLILGDNILYGQGFPPLLRSIVSLNDGAIIFGYKVNDPERFGVVEFNNENTIIGIEEKPLNPKSKFAVTGLYFYDNNVIDIAKKLKPSSRGELEITSLNNEYLKMGKLKLEILGRGYTWLDTGTSDSLIDASNFVRTIENRQGNKIACIEEISFRNGWISKNQLTLLAKFYENSEYGRYLSEIIYEDTI